MAEATVHGYTDDDEHPGQIASHRLEDAVEAPGRQVELVDRCPGCGTPPGTKAFDLRCSSCAQSLVSDSDLTEPVHPDALVPFDLDEDAARAAFRTWIEHRWFAPKSFKGAAGIRALDGVFLPYWSFSASTHSTYTGRRGTRRSRQVSRTRTNSNGQTETYWETETYVQWRNTAGEVGRFFESVLVPACSPLPGKLPHWPLDAPEPYTRGSSDGRRIIAYDVEPAEGFTRATAQMAAQIDEDVREDIGGHEQRVHEVSTAYADESCMLLLLPAYLVTYAHGTRTWSVLINGSSGEIAGDRPYSGMKITLLAVALAAAVAVLILLLTRH